VQSSEHESDFFMPSFTRTSWYPNHPDEKQAIVFEKQ